MFALLALLVRLAWPAPMPQAGKPGLAAVFGEHAICVAGATAGTPLKPASAPAPDSDHAEHDGLGCCTWHGNTGFTLPEADCFIRVAYSIRIAAPSFASIIPPSRPSGPAQARGPPLRA